MRRALITAVVLAAVLAIPAAAQMRGGVPASVTSMGFGGRHGFGGVPASVTSPGFGAPRTFIGGLHGGFRGGFNVRHNPRISINPRFDRRFGFDRRLFFRGNFSPFFAAPLVVPFFDYADAMTEPQPTTVVQPAQPQPIVIVIPSEREMSRREPEPPDPVEEKPRAPAKPEPAPPPTIVVLRNGQQLELTDYAIAGDTLFDLHGGRTRKIALADVDVAATIKLNEERGLEFSLPNSARVQIQ